MIRILDRYISRAFLGPCIVTLAVIVGLYTVAHAFSNLDEFLEQSLGIGPTLAKMATFYLALMPVFAVPVVPVALLIGAAYGVTILARNNELMAMKASGISLWRILTPIYTLSVVLACLAFANNEVLVPQLEATKGNELASTVGKDKLIKVPDVIEEERTLYIAHYNPKDEEITSVTVQIGDVDETATIIKADKAKKVEGGWNLTGNVEVNGEKATEYEWKTSLRRKDIERVALAAGSQPVRRLLRLLRTAPKDYVERPLWRYYLHRRLAYPISCIVLVALGLPFVLGSERIHRTRLLGVGVCVLLALVFYAVQMITQSMALGRVLPPEIAAWLPCLLFGGVALYLLETVHS